MNGITGEMSEDADMLARNSQNRTRATYSFGLNSGMAGTDIPALADGEENPVR